MKLSTVCFFTFFLALQFQLVMAGGRSQNCEPITQVQEEYAHNFVPGM